MKVCERIMLFLGLKGYTTNAFAQMSGIDPGNMRKMLAGKQRITDATLRKISNAHGLEFEWLKCGEGEMLRHPPVATESSSEEERDTGILLTEKNCLKVYTELDASASNIEDMNGDELHTPFKLIYIPGYENMNGFPVTGESMLPTFRAGDIIAVDKNPVNTIINGEIYLVVTRDGQRMIKRLVFAGMDEDGIGRIKCISDNPDKELYSTFEILSSSIHTISRVRGHLSFTAL